MNIDIIVPVLGRPEHADTFMKSLGETISTTDHRVRVFAMCENAEDYDAWEIYHAGYLTTGHTFPEKVNLGYTLTDAPWVLLVGSDVRFDLGWIHQLEVEIARMPTACVLGTLDLLNSATHAGEHTCHPLIRRDYIDNLGASWDGPGIVCSEAYWHNFVDNEIVQVAKDRGVWLPTTAVIEHLHPIVGKAEWDETYQEGEQWKSLDSMTWSRRLRQYGKSPSPT